MVNHRSLFISAYAERGAVQVRALHSTLNLSPPRSKTASQLYVSQSPLHNKASTSSELPVQPSYLGFELYSADEQGLIDCLCLLQSLYFLRRATILVGPMRNIWSAPSYCALCMAILLKIIL